jgi:hypothetical protein
MAKSLQVKIQLVLSDWADYSDQPISEEVISEYGSYSSGDDYSHGEIGSLYDELEARATAYEGLISG